MTAVTLAPLEQNKYYDKYTNDTDAAIEVDDLIDLADGPAVAQVDIAVDGEGKILIDGIFEGAKTTSQAWATAGLLVYEDSATGKLSTTAGQMRFVGHTYDAAPSANTLGWVRLGKWTDDPPRVLTLAATGAQTLSKYLFKNGKTVTVFAPNTAAHALTLPSVADIPVGSRLELKKTTADAYAVTITAATDELIDGAATHALINALNERVILVSNGTGWVTVADDLTKTVVTMAATGTTTLTVAQFAKGEVVVFAPNTAAVTLAVPAIASLPIGSKLIVRKTSADAFAVTIDPNASEQIAGGATFATIDAQYDWAIFVSDGSAWLLVDSEIA